MITSRPTVATRQRTMEARREQKQSELTLFLMNLGMAIIGDVDSGILSGRHSSVWAEATVFVHADYSPDKAWEPAHEPLCWKVAIRSSDAYGFYNGLTVRAWHRASYQDTVHVARASDEPELLALHIAAAMDGECHTEAEVAEREDRAGQSPNEQLAEAIRRVVKQCA